jgi:transposase, IS5 family
MRPEGQVAVAGTDPSRFPQLAILANLRERGAGGVEAAVIGHVKVEHRMERNYLWYRKGDAINAVLAAAGYNFRLLLRWLELLLSRILAALSPALPPVTA